MPDTKIHQPSQQALSDLSDIAGDDRCVLTVYFPGSDAQKGFDGTLDELPDGLVNAEHLSDDEAEHLRQCLELWRAKTEGLQLEPAPGWVGVASWMTEQVAFVPLPKEVAPQAYLDNSPFLYPAGRLLDDLEAYVVVFADHKRAIIYEAALGKLTEEDRLRGDIKNHVRKGGWSQQRYERRRDKEILHYCEGIAEKLQKILKEDGLRRVVLVGDQQLMSELQDRLGEQLEESVVDVLPMQNDAQEEKLFEETFAAAFAEEKREEGRLLKAIRAAHAADGKAVVGPNDTLAALREHRVHRLLIGPMENAGAWRCGGCGTFGLGKLPDACPSCRKSEALYEQSAGNELTDLAYEGGSSVEFTTDDMQEIGGVGALLRW